MKQKEVWRMVALFSALQLPLPLSPSLSMSLFSPPICEAQFAGPHNVRPGLSSSVWSQGPRPTHISMHSTPHYKASRENTHLHTHTLPSYLNGEMHRPWLHASQIFSVCMGLWNGGGGLEYSANQIWTRSFFFKGCQFVCICIQEQV